MFGQAMATFIPPMLPGTVRLHARIQPGRYRRADQDAARLGARLGAEDSRRAARARAAGGARGGDAGAEAARRQAMVAVPAHPSAVRLQVLELRRRRRAARGRARSVLVGARVRRHPGLRAHRNGADRQPEPSVRDQEGIGRQGDRRRRGEDRRRRRDPRARRERDDRLLQRRRRNARARSKTAGFTPATSARSPPTARCSSAGARRR